MMPGATSNVLRNVKVFRALGYLLVFLMLACAILTVGALIHNLLPNWHPGIITSILLFVVLDRLYTYRHLRSLTPLSSEWAIAIGGQWILVLLLMRLFLSYADGIDSLRAALASFARGDLAQLLTPEFVASLLLSLLAWFLAGRFLALLEEIGLDPQITLQEESAPIQMETVSPHQQLVSQIFSLGILLVVLTVLARINLKTLASDGEGLPNVEFNRLSGAEAGALLYFVFGLALLSLSRLMSLHTHWNRLRIPVSSSDLTRQWGIYSLLFLLLLALVVSLLPAGDSLGFFSVLATLFNFLVSILFFMGQVILSLIMLLMSLPFMLFGQIPPVLRPLAPPPLPVLPPPAEPVTPAPVTETWILMRSILLWGSLALLVVFALIQFRRQHGGLRAALRNARITNWLVLAWQWIYRNADRTRARLSRTIADGWQRIVSRLEENRILPPASLIRLRSLDPRRQIYFFYLAMVRRGGEQGVTRQHSQTPSEYAVTLEKTLPSAADDIDSLTEAFEKARYSRRDVHAGDVNKIQAAWERIRRALRNKSRNP